MSNKTRRPQTCSTAFSLNKHTNHNTKLTRAFPCSILVAIAGFLNPRGPRVLGFRFLVASSILVSPVDR
ncbi:hypothetical protein RJT34_18538 [Clitoria ternatea]|uniref:Uncharacterized protein n=1 Tax=Clitoria ternatea TaxID=43366 RepID=A0AAN9JBR4_CLITE